MCAGSIGPAPAAAEVDAGASASPVTSVMVDRVTDEDQDYGLPCGFGRNSTLKPDLRKLCYFDTFKSILTLDFKPTHHSLSVINMDMAGHTGAALRPTLLRVLCLHDAESDAHEMQEALAALGRRLFEQHGIDFVYVNSPLAVVRRSDGILDSRDEPRRVWWHGDDPSSEEISTEDSNLAGRSAVVDLSDDDESDSYDDDADDKSRHSLPTPQHQQPQRAARPALVGLDASLLYLQQVWTSGPYWGLLGIGQGATVASLFSLLPTTYPPPQCLVLCDASQALLPEEERLSHVPCLHAGTKVSERLVAQFGGQVANTTTVNPVRSNKASNPSSQTLPSGAPNRAVSRPVLNAVGRFLVGQRRATVCDPRSHGGEIVALQTALHVAEAEATEYIAREIAANPPKALMAIIMPHHVGGWSGGRRRQPGEQGGGAPCPEEFLLRRERRTTESEGAGRHHPQSSEGDSAQTVIEETDIQS
jgi:Serine hydrolase (FSH1)